MVNGPVLIFPWNVAHALKKIVVLLARAISSLTPTPALVDLQQIEADLWEPLRQQEHDDRRCNPNTKSSAFCPLGVDSHKAIRQGFVYLCREQLLWTDQGVLNS